MLAIFKKEFKSYFTSLTGWIYLAVNLFFAAWYFRYYSMVAGYPYISYVLSGILLIFLFTMPILTMRSFAEELKQKTDQLLFTAPIPAYKVVLGKFLALCSIFAIPVFIIGLYPLVLSVYGNVPFPENYLSIFGFLLFGIACISIGILISCLTDNQIIAAIMTFFVLLVCVMISGISELISINGNILTKCLSALDLTTYLNYFMNGMLYYPALVYFASIIFFCLYLTTVIVNKRRWANTHTGLVKSIAGGFGIVALLLVLIAVNVGLDMLPDTTKIKDITYNSIYSISDETKNYLATITDEITLYYLADKSSTDSTIEHTLKEIDALCDNITLKYVSPSENPSFYSAYTDSNPADNSIIVVDGDKSKVVNYYDCYEINYNYEYDLEAAEYKATDYSVSGYDGEGRIVSAITYVSSNKVPKIYCITGHDELNIPDTLRARLDKSNIITETINLLTYDEIPGDADGLYILGPLSDYSETDIEKIALYLKNGGNAILIVSYTDAEELSLYYSLLEPYNIKVADGLVIEQGTSFYNSQPYYLLPDILNTELTNGIYSYMRNKYIYMPYSKGFLLTEDYTDVDAQVFLHTTDNAYTLVSTDPDDKENVNVGQYILGVSATKIYPDSSSTVIAIGSDYFLDENINAAVNGNNYDLFINCTKKITGLGGYDDTYTAPIKKYSFSAVVIDQTIVMVYSIILVAVIPFGLLIVGFNIWYSRKKS